MAEMPFFPLATDAFLADTDHLTDAEVGRYVRLLIEAWQAPNCPIPHGAERHAAWERHPSRLLGSHWQKIRNAFLGGSELVCAYCRTTRATHWEVDHKIPRARGGTHDWANLAVSCRPCNRAKGAK